MTNLILLVLTIVLEPGSNGLVAAHCRLGTNEVSVRLAAPVNPGTPAASTANPKPFTGLISGPGPGSRGTNRAGWTPVPVRPSPDIRYGGAAFGNALQNTRPIPP